jgi:hypothetical protein
VNEHQHRNEVVLRGPFQHATMTEIEVMEPHLQTTRRIHEGQGVAKVELKIL